MGGWLSLLAHSPSVRNPQCTDAAQQLYHTFSNVSLACKMVLSDHPEWGPIEEELMDWWYHVECVAAPARTLYHLKHAERVLHRARAAVCDNATMRVYSEEDSGTSRPVRTFE